MALIVVQPIQPWTTDPVVDERPIDWMSWNRSNGGRTDSGRRRTPDRAGRRGTDPTWTSDPVVDERPIELDVVEPVQQWTADAVAERLDRELEDPLIDLSEELAGPF
jgi:hypothetical protein